MYDSNNDAISALNDGQIDGIVVDLPTAFFVVAVQLDDGEIVGKLPTRGAREQFGHGVREGQHAHALREPGAQQAVGERNDQEAPAHVPRAAGAPDLR